MPNEALIVVDMQNDFCDGGALAVPGGSAIVPLVNRLIGRHDHVVLTQDWHPAGHASFAGSWKDAEPFSVAKFSYGPQTLWLRRRRRPGGDSRHRSRRQQEAHAGRDAPGRDQSQRGRLRPRSAGHRVGLTYIEIIAILAAYSA